MRNINDNSIESKLRDALIKNPITRNRLVLEILKEDIKKCVKILMRKNRKNTRLYDVDDFIQEASINIINVLNNSNLIEVNCEIRTYLISIVKRTIWSIMREETRIKRQAQNQALPLIVFEDLRSKKNIYQAKIKYPFNVDAKVSIEDTVNTIEDKLNYPAKDIFKDLVNGYSIVEISMKQGIPLASVYTILRRKIRPVAKKIIEGE